LIWSKIGIKKYLKISKSYQQAYRCNRVRYREKKQCCTGCLIISPANTTKVEVHRTICAHDHREKVLSVSIDARIAIEEMFKVVKSIRPKNILANLEKINESYVLKNAERLNDPARQNEKDKVLIAIPLFADLYNYLARFRKKTLINGKDKFHLGDLHTWCADHESLPPPEEPDQVFVVRFQIFYPDEEYEVEDDYEAATAHNRGDQFRWFLSTRRLISFSSNFKIVLQTDGTYKLMWIGNSVLLLGSSDFNRVFHPVGLAVCSREAQ
jgi:hypothetical protein